MKAAISALATLAYSAGRALEANPCHGRPNAALRRLARVCWRAGDRLSGTVEF
jgi:hypothetical protein